ncbi:hypothetical protein Tco_0282585 [Tanacetum coccineum]
MSTPKFAETHNLVAFLEKPEESSVFEEIIDFLNASYVQYVLTVSPTIYTTYIEQFWASAKAKIVNGERQIQALVDKKNVNITDTSIRSDLKLDDAEGIDYLPTSSIFTELERMGYENLTQKLTFYKAYFSSQWKFLIHTILQCLSAKTTAWNEFSSTMASTIICLATNQTFNFSKYIFDNMVKHLEGGVKFLMYPRFVQVFLDKQVEGMTRHKEVYVTPSHTKKVFANMKRSGKGFSGRVTPLFPIIMIQASEDMGKDSKKSRRKQRKDSSLTELVTDEAHVSTPSYDLPQSGEDSMQLSELMNLCTSLQEKVLDLEKAKTAQAKEIASLKKRVKQLEKRRKLRTLGFKILRKVGSTSRIESSTDVSLGAQEDASKQERKIIDLDADAEVTLVDETQEMNEDNLMFDTGVLEEQEFEFEKVVEEPIVSVATTTKSIPVSDADLVTTAGEVVTTASVEILDELTLAQSLIEIKTEKPKPVTTAVTTITSVRPRAKGIIFHDQEEQILCRSDSVDLVLRERIKRLRKLVIEKHGINRPVDEYERVLLDDMKVEQHTDVLFLGLKDFKMILRVTIAQLQLLSDYYCWKNYADTEGIKIDWRTRILTKIKIKDYVQKQCDEDGAACQEAIIAVTNLFNQAYTATQAMREEYVECKDIPQERRVVIDKFLKDEASKDYKIERKL